MFLLELRNRHFFLIDALILLVTPTLALMLRVDTVRISQLFWLGLLGYTVIAIALRLVIFRRFGLYSHYWKYASIDELVQIGTAVLVSTFLLTIIVLLVRSTYAFQFARPLDPGYLERDLKKSNKLSTSSAMKR